MSFIHALYLVGIVGVAGPILYHLLLRNRTKRQILPTLRFLPSSAPKSQAMHRLKNILLLILRLLILLLVVFAFARPFLQPEEAASDEETLQEGVVFAVDASMSMRTHNRWKNACGRVHTLLQTLPRESRFALMLFDRTPQVVCPATDDRITLETALKNSDAGFGSTDIAAAIRAAADAASKYNARRKSVYVISDFQETGLNEIMVDLNVPEGVEIIPIPVDDTEPANLAVTGVREIDTQTPERRRVVVRIENHSPQKHEAKLRIMNGKQSLAAKNVVLKSEARRAIDFNLQLKKEKEYTLAAELVVKDALEEDNTRPFLLKAQTPLPVMIVSAAARINLKRNPSDSIPEGVNPYLRSAVCACGDDLDPRWTHPSQIRDISASDVPVVIGYECEVYPPGLVSSLQEYIQSGGMLVLFPGNGDLTNMREIYGDEIADWKELDTEEEYRLVTGGADKGVFSLLNASSRSLLGHPRAFRYIEVDTQEDTDTEAIVQFDDGSPFLLGKKRGRGCVYLFTVPLDQNATDFVLRASFAPFLFDLLNHASKQATLKREYMVGDLFSPFRSASRDSTEEEEGSSILVDPDNNLTIVTANARSFTRPGIYMLRQNPVEQSLVVALEEQESDLRMMDEAQIQHIAQLGKNANAAGAIQTDSIQRSILKDTPPPDSKWRIWWYLMIAVLGLIAIETLLASRTVR